MRNFLLYLEAVFQWFHMWCVNFYIRVFFNFVKYVWNGNLETDLNLNVRNLPFCHFSKINIKLSKTYLYVFSEKNQQFNFPTKILEKCIELQNVCYWVCYSIIQLFLTASSRHGPDRWYQITCFYVFPNVFFIYIVTTWGL